MKRQKKKRLILRIFRNLICIGLFVILAALLGNAWVIGSTKGLIKKESEVKSSKADCILVLGAGVHKDNSPSLMLRDRLARDKDVVSVLRKTKPTYLGEAIPVSGDGDATNDQ